VPPESPAGRRPASVRPVDSRPCPFRSCPCRASLSPFLFRAPCPCFAGAAPDRGWGWRASERQAPRRARACQKASRASAPEWASEWALASAWASASASASGEEWERASASHRASSVPRSQDEASGPSRRRDSRRVDRRSSLRVIGHLRAARRPPAATTRLREPHARSAEVKTAAQSAIARLHAVGRTAPAWPLRRRWLPSTARRLERARFFPSCCSPRLSIPRSSDVSAPGV
jgi:hypothetical protein